MASRTWNYGKARSLFQEKSDLNMVSKTISCIVVLSGTSAVENQITLRFGFLQLVLCGQQSPIAYHLKTLAINLTVSMQALYEVVLHATQVEVGLGQEVAAATGGV